MNTSKRFVLYRILGNDLPPRHRIGQTLRNLAFILDHEPLLEDCERRWVVNRIADSRIEAQIMNLLDERKERYLRIPFVEAEYMACQFDFESLPQQYFLYRAASRALVAGLRIRLINWCYRKKNLYLMNVNGARNAALREGRALADWVMPLDSACFFTAAGWASVLEAAGRAGSAKYLIVPMVRLIENESVFDPAYRPQGMDEPQIAFRRDAGEAFDETLRFGTMDKSVLLRRLGVPGPWQRSQKLVFDKIDLTPSPEADRFVQAGWVARLASGNPQADADHRTRIVQRWSSITRFCVETEARIIRRTLPDDHQLSFFDTAALGGQRHAWLAGDPAIVELVNSMRLAAERALGVGALSADCSRLQRFLHHVTVLALCWVFTREDRFVRHAADLLRARFVASTTRMNPQSPYARARSGQGHTGIFETCDLTHALDAIRIVRRSGALSVEDATALCAWFRARFEWLRTSAQGVDDASSANHVGTCFDLEIAAIAAFLGDIEFFCHYLNSSRMRIAQQIRPDGAQPEEGTGPDSLHYALLNLQLWANLARLARAAGIDLWSFQMPDGRGLARALATVGTRVKSAAVNEPALARIRLEVLQEFAAVGTQAARSPRGQKYRLPACVHPDLAVAPFWQLGLPDESTSVGDPAAALHSVTVN